MRCPTLAELPPPPAGRTGWPWTEACAQLPDRMPDGRPWPRISIVTPSYNQGAYIEETIRSILLQGYPDLEYVVMDGGSTDGALDVVRRYEPWLAAWRSEPDRGQPDAINKGVRRCTGTLFQFINSDDIVAPQALKTVAETSGDADAVAGIVQHFSNESAVDYANAALNPIDMLYRRACFRQPGVWLRLAHVRQVGEFDISLHHTFDKDFLIKYLYTFPKVAYVGTRLVYFRLHEASKTLSEQRHFQREYPRLAMSLASYADDVRIRTCCYRFLIDHWKGQYASATFPARCGWASKARWLIAGLFGPAPSAALRIAFAGVRRRIPGPTP